MELIVNGEPKQTEVSTLEELLREFDIDTPNGEDAKGMAVAVNDSVVPRSDWQNHRLKETDRIEIIRATQGG